MSAATSSDPAPRAISATTPPASCQRHSGTRRGHRSRPVTRKAAPARDYEKMARHFIACAGPFSANAGNGTVTHHVDVSLFPNWQGHNQVRRVTIEGRTAENHHFPDQTAADGRTFHSELIWLRV